MNEFAFKKLGEVLAFSRAGLVIFEKGKGALKPVLLDDFYSIQASFQDHVQKIAALADEMGGSEIVLPKSEKTKAKLLEMAELYIGDEWDNSAELMEWLGFFEGAAIVHWRLVEGVAEKTQNQKLQELVADGLTTHQNIFKKIEKEISAYAKTKL